MGKKKSKRPTPPERRSAVSTVKTVDEGRPLGANPYPIVAVGASAGGLEAFTQLLRHLPVDTGMAFVLVQHLSPQKASILTELLSKTTPMPVTQVKDGMATEPNHIYVIPPNADMDILHGVLHLVPRTEVHGHHMPIDFFMRSLAEDQGQTAIGLVLSGTASDGALGLKSIKAKGGITFAQDEKSATYYGMPRSAIAAGYVDFVLPPQEIAKELARIGKHPYVSRLGAKQRADVHVSEGADDTTKVIISLRNATGVDFSFYKQSTVHRRILRRMLLHKIGTIGEYTKYLQANAKEVEALYNDILINVTGFFRDPDSFEALAKKALPAIMKAKRPAKPLRVWVPGCSTGEEAYSIAICLLEFLQNSGRSYSVQIFSTDICDVSIEKARRGIYPENITADVSQERLRRFFARVEGGYQVSKSIRDMCIFAHQDVTKDPPFLTLDLISCRNLLIYLGPILQKKVMSIFHYALQPNGLLWLGPSETIGGFSDLFGLMDKKNKFYSKKTTIAGLHLDLSRGGFPIRGEFPMRESDAVEPTEGRIGGSFDAQKEADHIVMSEYAPPGVIINDDLEILQFRGRTGLYLEPAPGEASLNILRMAREGLLPALRSAIQNSKKDNALTVRNGIQVKSNGRTLDVQVGVFPLKHAEQGQRCFLVLFRELTQRAVPERRRTKSSRPASKKQRGTDEAGRLRQELAETREYLQSIIQEREAANEELRSANEEIQSSNEELQSTNEELETAKEELQSTNEELTTVNEEMENRNLELIQVNDDLNNLLTSVDIPIIILGMDLRIRLFTPMAGKAMNVISTDIGRKFTDIRPNVAVTDLEQSLLKVVETLHSEEREVQDGCGRWYSMRLRPYRTSENKIDGVVIALIDIDGIKHIQGKLLRQLATIVRDSNDAITVQNFEGKILAWNKGAEEMYGYSEAEALLMNIREMVPEAQRKRASDFVERISRGEVIDSFRTTRIAKDGRMIEVLLTVSPLVDHTDKPYALATTERDMAAGRGRDAGV